MSKAQDWGGPNYLKDPNASRRLANQLKEYYKFSPLYDKIETKVVYDKITNCYLIKSNIAELMESVTTVEERVGL